MEPFGSYAPIFPEAVALAIGALCVASATALLELSRTLAETYKGRWFAGNGRDVFHVFAAGVLGSAMLSSGLPPALAVFAAATTVLVPLLVLDGLPARRRTRVTLLLAMVALAAAPPLLEPRSIVDACNAMARALF